MDEANFLRALAERPTDETLRAAYADWLEERGDLRGIYLRAELEAAALSLADSHRTGPGAGSAESPAENPALVDVERRLRELLPKIDADWLDKAGLRFDLYMATNMAGNLAILMGRVQRVLPRWMRFFDGLAHLFTGSLSPHPIQLRVRARALWREADDLRARLKSMLLSGELDMQMRFVLLTASEESTLPGHRVDTMGMDLRQIFEGPDELPNPPDSASPPR